MTVPLELTLEQVLAACPSGPAKGSRSHVLIGAFDTPGWSEPISHVRAMTIWVLDFLYTIIPPEDAGLFASTFNPAWIEDDQLVVTVTDGAYVGFNTMSRVYDSSRSVWIDRIPSVWFETRVFNTVELAKLCLSRIKT